MEGGGESEKHIADAYDRRYDFRDGIGFVQGRVGQGNTGGKSQDLGEA